MVATTVELGALCAVCKWGEPSRVGYGGKELNQVKREFSVSSCPSCGVQLVIWVRLSSLYITKLLMH